MIKSLIFNIFKKTKDRTVNEDVITSKEVRTINQIPMYHEIEVCSEEKLRNILKRQFVFVYGRGGLSYDAKDMLKSIDAFRVNLSSVPIKEACHKFGFNNYNGMIIDNRIEALKVHSIPCPNPEFLDFNIANILYNKEIRFIKNGDLVNIQLCENKKKYVLKSEKEKELKKLYDYLKQEVDKIDKEVIINKNYRIIDSSLTRKREDYNVSIYDFIRICKETKPNIITDFDMEAISSEINSITCLYEKIYYKYLRYRLESIKKEYEAEVYGRIGEESVIETTNNFDNCIAIHNVILPASKLNGEEYLFEIDTILVTTRGIFILEVKNYGTVGNYELRIDGTGRWSTYYPNSGKEITRDNPNKQNNMHVINFNKFINKYLPQYNGEIDSIGVIVIGNDDVKITQENQNTNIKRIDELYNYVKEHPSRTFSLEEVNEISQCIEKYRSNIEKSYPINDFSYEFLNNINFIREDLKLLGEIRKSIFTEKGQQLLLDSIYSNDKNKVVYPKRKVEGETLKRYNRYVGNGGGYEIVSNLGYTFAIYPEDIFDSKINW